MNSKKNSHDFFIYQPPNHRGPYTLLEIKNFLKNGQLLATDFVFSEGYTREWKMVYEVPELDPQVETHESENSESQSNTETNASIIIDETSQGPYLGFGDIVEITSILPDVIPLAQNKMNHSQEPLDKKSSKIFDWDRYTQRQKVVFFLILFVFVSSISSFFFMKKKTKPLESTQNQQSLPLSRPTPNVNNNQQRKLASEKKSPVPQNQLDSKKPRMIPKPSSKSNQVELVDPEVYKDILMDEIENNEPNEPEPVELPPHVPRMKTMHLSNQELLNKALEEEILNNQENLGQPINPTLPTPNKKIEPDASTVPPNEELSE